MKRNFVTAVAVVVIALLSSCNRVISLPDGFVGHAYRASLPGITGKGALNCIITSGALPDGLFLNPGTGEISGTPSKAGRFDFTVRIKDSATPPTGKSEDLRIRISQPGSSARGAARKWKGTFNYRLEQQVPSGPQISTAKVEIELEENSQGTLEGTAEGFVTSDLFLTTCKSSTTQPGKLHAKLEGNRRESTMELRITSESWDEIKISPCSTTGGMPEVMNGGRIYELHEALKELKRVGDDGYRYDSKKTYPSVYPFTVTHAVVVRRAD